MKRPGPKLKYRHLLVLLEPGRLYSPAMIARLGEVLECYGSGLDHEALKLAKRRVRINMARFSCNHRFPREGDGQIKLKGQPYMPGWFGWRWQAAAGIQREKP